MERRKVFYCLSNVIAWILLACCAYVTFRIGSAVSTPRYVVVTNEVTHVIFRDVTNELFCSSSESAVDFPSSSVPSTFKHSFHAYKLGSVNYNFVDFETGGTYTIGEECDFGVISRIFPTRIILEDGTVIENMSPSNYKRIEPDLPKMTPPI